MSTTAARTTSVEPWYRQRWPWILIAIPAMSVVAGMVLLYFAITTWDGLVVDDYYRHGQAIDQTVARSARAAELGLTAELVVRAEEISVRVAASDLTSIPAALILTIAHPTRGGHDQILRLEAAGGTFAAPVLPLTTGRWLIQIEDEAKTWRLNGAVYVPTATNARIVPYGT